MQVFRPLPVSPTTHFTIFLHDLYLFSHVLTSSQLCLHSPLAVRSSSGPVSESFIFFLPASIIFLKNEQRSKKKILLLCISSAFVRKCACGLLWQVDYERIYFGDGDVPESVCHFPVIADAK